MYRRWCAQGSKVLGILMLISLILYQAVFQYQTVLVTHWSTDKYKWTAEETTDLSSLNYTISCKSSDTSSGQWC